LVPRGDGPAVLYPPLRKITGQSFSKSYLPRRKSGDQHPQEQIDFRGTAIAVVSTIRFS
jgi:hypothetical protein